MSQTDLPRRRVAAGLALAPLATCLPALGQGSLPKSIVLLVPQAAGGSNDVMARAVAARLPHSVSCSRWAPRRKPRSSPR